jgi:hypothetical protein
MTGVAVEERLDWQGFCTRYFPGRRRHDLEALVAYGAYRRAHAVESPPAGVDAVKRTKAK